MGIVFCDICGKFCESPKDIKDFLYIDTDCDGEDYYICKSCYSSEKEDLCHEC